MNGLRISLFTCRDGGPSSSYSTFVSSISEYDSLLSGMRRDSGASGIDTSECGVFGGGGYSDLQLMGGSRRSSAFSTASGIINEEAAAATTTSHFGGNTVDPNRLAAPPPLSAGFGSASSNEGSTDSLLEQDLHNLSLAVTQQALD